MAEKYIATEPLFIGRARAANKGDEIHTSTLKAHPEWAKKVRKVTPPKAEDAK